MIDLFTNNIETTKHFRDEELDTENEAVIFIFQITSIFLHSFES